MNKKTLVLLTDNYPDTAGEFFLDDELKIIAPSFEKIIVIQKKSNEPSCKHYTPKNLTLYIYPNTNNFLDYLGVIPLCFRFFFIKELFGAKKLFKISYSILQIKIMIVELLWGNKLKKEIIKVVRKEKLDINKTLFYSYWSDYKSMGLALYKNKFPSALCFARVHGWDVDYSRHKFPYLPFKNYVVSQLNRVFAISEKSQQLFFNLIEADLKPKIFISRLGKTNYNSPQCEKKNKDIVICSCSDFISLKRIHLIIDILSNIKSPNIEWIHFGGGILKEEMEKYAQKKLSHIKYSFKGIVPNEEIIKFYSENFIDLFINVSETEGIPVSIMEAQSFGIPTLATNVGGTSEIVNNENGFLIEKDFNPKLVADLITQYFSSDVQTQRQKRIAAFKNWSEKYNAEMNYSLYLSQIQFITDSNEKSTYSGL
ncbi:MAG: hypothetical protein A3F72_05080 [Bacteroidetes bacterium RIFCSPLOWO2_12_FULL_35_15]|nr:MAG: hypothetical protein A3F72_05080 [Bacteroidetes bacterium RIFCSPLOWO2_12_FULL_35_15]